MSQPSLNQWSFGQSSGYIAVQSDHDSYPSVETNILTHTHEADENLTV